MFDWITEFVHEMDDANAIAKAANERIKVSIRASTFCGGGESVLFGVTLGSLTVVFYLAFTGGCTL